MALERGLGFNVLKSNDIRQSSFLVMMSLRYVTVVAGRAVLSQQGQRAGVAVIKSTTPAQHLRQFSSTSDSDENPGFFGRIKNSFTDRQERKAQEQFADQLQKMANSERWTIKDFHDDLSLVADSWRSKIPGMTNISQVKSAKQMNSISKAIIEVVGSNATASELLEMPRTDKLKVSVKSGASVEDINVMLQQFQGVEVMHQVVRRRKLEGRPIPQDQTSMRSILQVEGLQVMNKTQRKNLKEVQMKKGMRGMGRKR